MQFGMESVSPGWEARFPGVCEHCGGWFKVGTPIRWISYDSGTVAHSQCPDEEPVEESAAAACSDCHLVHSGECW